MLPNAFYQHLIIGVILILVVIIILLMVYNMSIHKKIESFNNLNQKITNLNILQDFMNTLGECTSTNEKLEKINNILALIDEELQTFITTTNIANVDKKLLEKAKVFHIKDGEIKEE